MDSTSSPYQPPAMLQIMGGVYILYGSLDLVGMISTSSLYFAPLEAQTGLMADMLRSDATFATIMRALFIPSLLLALLQFCSGVGLLRASRFARKVAIGCAVYGIAAALFSTWLTLTYTLPFTLDHTLRQVKNPEMTAATRNITLVSFYVKIALGLLYPLVSFILLKRTKIRPYY